MRAFRVALVAAALAAAAIAPTAGARAAEVTINTVVPISFVVDACGEPVLVQGALHVLIHITQDAAGGSIFKVHFQPMGITGVGLTTGTQFQGTGVTQETDTNNGPGGQLEGTFVNNFRIISHGTTPNFDVHENGHFTVNDKGELTVVHDNASVECRG